MLACSHLLPAKYRSRLDTSRAAKEMSEALDAIGVKFSSSKIQHLFTGATGGTGETALKTVDLISPSRVSKPSPTLANFPGPKAFVVRTPLATTDSVDFIYRRMAELQQNQKAANEARRTPTGRTAGAKPLTGAAVQELRRYEVALDKWRCSPSWRVKHTAIPSSLANRSGLKSTA